jgi:hypothetical protein
MISNSPKYNLGDTVCIVDSGFSKTGKVGDYALILSVVGYREEMYIRGLIPNWSGPAGHVYRCSSALSPEISYGYYHESELVKLCKTTQTLK